MITGGKILHRILTTPAGFLQRITAAHLIGSGLGKLVAVSAVMYDFVKAARLYFIAELVVDLVSKYTLIPQQ